MPLKTGLLKIIKELPNTITIDEVGIQSTVSIDRSTLGLQAKYAEEQLVSTSDEPLDRRDDKVDEGGQNTAEELDDAPPNTQSISLCVM